MFWSMFTLAVVVCTAAVILNYRVQREMRAGSRMTESRHADAERGASSPSKLPDREKVPNLLPLKAIGTRVQREIDTKQLTSARMTPKHL
jgi:hypothetical protein